MTGTRYPVSDGLYITIDRRMSELKHRLSDPKGSLIDPDEILVVIQRLIESLPTTTPLPDEYRPSETLPQIYSRKGLDSNVARGLRCIYRYHSWAERLGDLVLIPQSDLDDIRDMGPRAHEALIKFMADIDLPLADPTIDRSDWYSINGNAIPPNRLMAMTVVQAHTRLAGIRRVTHCMELTHLEFGVLNRHGISTIGSLFNVGREGAHDRLASRPRIVSGDITYDVNIAGIHNTLDVIMCHVSKTGSW